MAVRVVQVYSNWGIAVNGYLDTNLIFWKHDDALKVARIMKDDMLSFKRLYDEDQMSLKEQEG